MIDFIVSVLMIGAMVVLYKIFTTKDEEKETNKYRYKNNAIKKYSQYKDKLRHDDNRPINTINSDKGNLYNTIYNQYKEDRISKEEKKKIFEKNRKERYKKHIKETAQKGRIYELYINDYFKKLGYTTKAFGEIHGKKDHGIDLIIKKEKNITFIQCKNWKQDGKYKIKHSHLKEFIGNTTAFIEKNKDKAEGYNIKRLYVTSFDILDNSAKHFLRDNEILEHAVIPMKL